jgi:hypothetical protein
MQQVHDHQRQVDKVREDYTYVELTETDDVDSSGRVKKTESEEHEVFFVNSHEIRHHTKKNGHELNAGEQKKEHDRVDKEVAKALKTPPDHALNGNSVSITRILAIMKVSNPRCITLNGRDTITFDFAGDPHAHTHGLAEDLSKKISGTLWVDEKDREVARLEARFDDNFRIGGGVLATVQKGSTFTFEQAPVEAGLWLPTGGHVHIGARAMLVVGIREDVRTKDGDFKKFHAEAVMKPGAVEVAPEPRP